VSVRRTEAPDEARSRCGLDRADYAYACALAPTPDDRSAEAWARAVFDGAPRALRAPIVLGWRHALRLRLARRSMPAAVLGWAVTANAPDAIVLAADSPLLTARIVVLASDDRVVHTTLVRLDNAIGRALWAVAAPIHQLVIPVLLRHAAKQAGDRR
jgi:Protein of unknown function (DUF2867)